MIYCKDYQSKFGPKLSDAKLARLAKQAKAAEEKVEEPVVALVEAHTTEESVSEVEALAKDLADNHTKTELKAKADELGIEYKSNIREMALATLLAEYQLKEGVEE